jgi:hypothetical protein
MVSHLYPTNTLLPTKKCNRTESVQKSIREVLPAWRPAVREDFSGNPEEDSGIKERFIAATERG